MLPKWFTPIVVMSVAGLSIWLLIEQDPKETQHIALRNNVADAFMDNFSTYILNEKGTPRYEIHASHMAHFPYDDHSEFTSPRFMFYQPGDNQWEIKAAKGITKDGAESITLQDKVIIQRRRNFSDKVDLQISTSKLLIKLDESYAETDQLITITSGDHQLQSNGIRAYFDKGQVELLSRVRGKYVL